MQKSPATEQEALSGGGGIGGGHPSDNPGPGSQGEDLRGGDSIF